MWCGVQAYLASSSEEEEIGTGDAAALRERYRALLLANSNGDNARTGGPKGRAWGGGGDPNTEASEASDSDAAEGDSGNAKVQTPAASCCLVPTLLVVSRFSYSPSLAVCLRKMAGLVW